MDLGLLWRASLGQLMAVAALFLLLLALPLSEDFFRGYGAVVGPLSWLVCSLATGRVLALGLGTTLRAAVASGAAAGLVGLVLSHALGLIVGVAIFGAVVASLGRGRLPGRSAPVGAR